MDILFESLSQRLKQPLPGPKIWKKWSANHNNHYKPPSNPKHAAVMICLYRQKNDLFLPVMVRTSDGGPHSGQISLPGGAFESDKDLSLTETALRETEEEMGIPKQDIGIAGMLSPLYIPVSNFLVQPVVGQLEQLPIFRADNSEVHRIVEVPIKALLDPKNQTDFTFHYKEKEITSPAFNIGKDRIWGATAMILTEFLAILNQSILIQRMNKKT